MGLKYAHAVLSSLGLTTGILVLYAFSTRGLQDTDSPWVVATSLLVGAELLRMIRRQIVRRSGTEGGEK